MAMDYFLQIGLPLIGIVGLILVLGVLGKRLNLAKPLGSGPIKVMASVPVSNQVKLCLIEVGGQQMLISVSGQQTNCLHTLPERVPQSESGTPDFSRYMQNLLSRNDQ
ncbi:FliO/MopB family protein [Parendozoicomonas haliclonae]|uniref:Flagellar protein FliO n=1 Tax=Parendozoicomonas haliclonae TaxID=1960125 RepID=A0A1X7AGL2_9GAMM|nr:flagellar biosynthetic protein FliO [Parendozoicomonas haliclonae]SMA39945.1 Flagellar protein FliO [Parendozoicomonas haliclonae]